MNQRSKKKPLVSVFLSYYNDIKYLEQSIKSVINQTYENWELILLNHATTDNCRELAHSFKDSRIIHIDLEYNYGAGGGILFSEMLKSANGKYIKTLCADDILKENCLSDMVDYMESSHDISFAFGKAEYINEESKIIKDNFFEKYGFDIRNSNIDELKLFKKGIGHSPFPAAIFRTNDLKKIDIDNIFIMEFDMSIYLELLIREYNVGFVDKNVVLYRFHEDQMSRDKEGHSTSFINEFELPRFFDIFYKMKSINLVKQVFDDSVYAEKLSDNDEKFIPFVIAHSFAYSDNRLANKSGYDKLADILNNNKMRKEIENKFDYTVNDFRQRYKIKPTVQKIEHTQIIKIPFTNNISANLPSGKYGIQDIKVFIPTLNRPDYLKQSIQSLVYQSAGCPEITVYNNGELQETSDVINEFKEYGVKEVKSKGNLLDCMNDVQKSVKSPYIMFFHDDDILNSMYLEIALKALNKYENISFVTTRFLPFKKVDEIKYTPATEDHFLFTKQEDFANYMYLYETVAMQTAIYNTELFKKYPREFDKYGKFFDYPYLVTLAGLGNVVLANCRRIFNARIHEEQWSNDETSSWTVPQLINWHEQFAKAMKYTDKKDGYKIFNVKFKHLICSQYDGYISNALKKTCSKAAMLERAINQIGINTEDEFYNADISEYGVIKAKIQSQLIPNIPCLPC